MKIDISVIILAYNHEKFIRRSLDSVLFQNTEFSCEIIVGEDCSADGTADILEQYEERYPDRLVLLKRTRNLGMRKNLQDCLRQARGQFIALLEGDDYWISPVKLQKQAEFLAAHQDYIAVGGDYKIVDVYGNVTGHSSVNQETMEYSVENYRRFELPGQTSTLMIRNVKNGALERFAHQMQKRPILPPDRIGPLVLLQYGRIAVLPGEMSAHRRYIIPGKQNWTTQHYMGKNPNYLFRFRLILEMERLLEEYGYGSDHPALLELRAEIFFKAHRAIHRETNFVYMWLQCRIMRRMDPCHAAYMRQYRIHG